MLAYRSFPPPQALGGLSEPAIPGQFCAAVVDRHVLGASVQGISAYCKDLGAFVHAFTALKSQASPLGRDAPAQGQGEERKTFHLCFPGQSHFKIVTQLSSGQSERGNMHGLSLVGASNPAS